MKKRLAALETAITLDDVLYERFRLNADLHKQTEKIMRSLQVEVLAKKDGMLYSLTILELHHSPDGMQIVVKMP